MKGSFFVGLNFDGVVFFFFLEVSNDSNVCVIVWVLGWFICYVLRYGLWVSRGREIARRKGGLCVRADTDRSVCVSELTCNRKCDFCECTNILEDE